MLTVRRTTSEVTHGVGILPVSDWKMINNLKYYTLQLPPAIKDCLILVYAYVYFIFCCCCKLLRLFSMQRKFTLCNLMRIGLESSMCMEHWAFHAFFFHRFSFLVFFCGSFYFIFFCHNRIQSKWVNVKCSLAQVKKHTDFREKKKVRKVQQQQNKKK